MKKVMSKAGTPIFKQSFKTLENAAKSGTSGYCLACGKKASGVEPDARRYACSSCGKERVYGAEELVMMGMFH